MVENEPNKTFDLENYLNEVKGEVSQEDEASYEEKFEADMRVLIFDEKPGVWETFVNNAVEEGTTPEQWEIINKLVQERVEPLRTSDKPEDKPTLRLLLKKLEGLTELR